MAARDPKGTKRSVQLNMRPEQGCLVPEITMSIGRAAWPRNRGGADLKVSIVFVGNRWPFRIAADIGIACLRDLRPIVN